MWTATIHCINASMHRFECMHKPIKEDTVGFEKTCARFYRNKCHK